MGNSIKDFPPTRCLVVGDINIDFTVHTKAFPQEGGRAHANRASFRLGGSGCVTALMLQKLGISTTLAANLGEDVFSQFIWHHLTASGLDTSFVHAHPVQQTGFFTILASTSGSRTTIGNRGANQLAVDAPGILSRLEEFDHLHLSGYTLIDDDQYHAGRELMGAFKRAGKTVSLDPGICTSNERAEQVLALAELVDYFLPSQEEFESLAEGDSLDKKIMDLFNRGFKKIAVKLGTEGARYADKNSSCHAPAENLKSAIIDTTGAGDCFNAGFLSAIFKGLTPLEALQAGNQAASRILIAANGIIDLV